LRQQRKKATAMTRRATTRPTTIPAIAPGLTEVDFELAFCGSDVADGELVVKITVEVKVEVGTEEVGEVGLVDEGHFMNAASFFWAYVVSSDSLVNV